MSLLVPTNMSDHDLLITVANDLTHIKNELCKVTKDHEMRIRKVEERINLWHGVVLAVSLFGSWLIHKFIDR